MTKKQIVDAWAVIRKENHSIPDDVLDFMKDAALEKLNEGVRNDPSWQRTDEQILDDLKRGTSFGMK